MKQLFAAASFLVLISAAPAVAQQQQMTAEQFIMQAQQGNMAEVALGRMAEQKAQNPEIKGFARGMVNDHGKAEQQLSAIAQKKGVQVPPNLDDPHKQTAERLGRLEGQQFDSAYMKQMVEDHQKDVQFYRQAQSAINDAEVKAYIDQTLPILQSHLRTATSLAQPEAAEAGQQQQQQQQQQQTR